ncbi:MAG TPA: hypothetical protein VGL92_07900 [Acidimicrobiia bacterium]
MDRLELAGGDQLVRLAPPDPQCSRYLLDGEQEDEVGLSSFPSVDGARLPGQRW